MSNSQEIQSRLHAIAETMGSHVRNNRTGNNSAEFAELRAALQAYLPHDHVTMAQVDGEVGEIKAVLASGCILTIPFKHEPVEPVKPEQEYSISINLPHEMFLLQDKHPDTVELVNGLLVALDPGRTLKRCDLVEVYSTPQHPDEIWETDLYGEVVTVHEDFVAGNLTYGHVAIVTNPKWGAAFYTQNAAPIGLTMSTESYVRFCKLYGGTPK